MTAATNTSCNWQLLVNESLGLVSGGVGLHGGGEPEKTTNESLGLVGGGVELHGGGGGLCGSNHRVYCKTLVSIFFK